MPFVFLSVPPPPPTFFFPLSFCVVTEGRSPRLSLPRWQHSVRLSNLSPKSYEECVLKERENRNA